MQSLADLKKIVDEEFTTLDFKGNPQDLYDPLNYILSLGGKRLRPLLCLISADIFGGRTQEVVPAAKAIEVFHNFTLMHDDIMDAASLRRGKATVHTKWNINTAILSGDLMLVKSIQFLLDLPPVTKDNCIVHFLKTAAEVCEGQQMDMNFGLREDVTEEEYVEMIRLKTAVLLGCALYCGTYTATGDEQLSHKMYAYGCAVGIAFQVWDDWLDVFGESAETGKIQAGDIREGKKTIVYLKAKSVLTGDTKQEFLRAYTQPAKNEDDIQHLLSLLRANNVDESVKKQYQEYFLEAEKLLDQITGYDLSTLKLFVEELKHRSK